jgi:hypothetical protein
MNRCLRKPSLPIILPEAHPQGSLMRQQGVAMQLAIRNIIKIFVKPLFVRKKVCYTANVTCIVAPMCLLVPVSVE